MNSKGNGGESGGDDQTRDADPIHAAARQADFETGIQAGSAAETAAATEVAGGVPAVLLEQLGRVRLQVEQLLDLRVDEATVEFWEMIVDDHVRAFATSPPDLALTDLLDDSAQAGDLLARVGLSGWPRRLLGVSAKLNGLTAAHLLTLGHYGEARAWLHTAGTAAEHAGERDLQAWVTAWASATAFFRDDPRRALRHARAAQGLSAAAPGTRSPGNATAGWAAALAALALARMGRAHEAEASLGLAETQLERLIVAKRPRLPVALDEPTLRAFQGTVLSELGRPRQAAEASGEALRLGLLHPTGIALQRVEHARNLLRLGDADEACALVDLTLRDLPTAYRAGPVLGRIRQFIRAIPGGRHYLEAARSLHTALNAATVSTTIVGAGVIGTGLAGIGVAGDGILGTAFLGGIALGGAADGAA